MLMKRFYLEERLILCNSAAPMKLFWTFQAVCASLLLCACGIVGDGARDDGGIRPFGRDLDMFAKCDVKILLLRDGNAAVAVSPENQGTVLTATLSGENGPSLGWFDRELVAMRQKQASKSPLGGLDRLFVGPEGGEFSIYFPDGASFSESSYVVPAELCSEKWETVSASKTRARFARDAEFVNALGTRMKARLDREVTLLTRANVAEILGVEIPDALEVVAYQSLNRITNFGKTDWSEKSGLLNLDVATSMPANRKVNVFVPYRQGSAAEFGDIFRDNCQQASGIIDSGRLLVTKDFIRMKADGRSIAGVGVSPKRSEGIALSYDAANNILTVITYIRPATQRAYLQNSWRTAGGQFEGDALSVYSNGPIARTSLAAPAYYKIATFSPALNLKSGQSQIHVRRTFHFRGSEFDLGLLAYKLASISIEQLRGDEE